MSHALLNPVLWGMSIVMFTLCEQSYAQEETSIVTEVEAIEDEYPEARPIKGALDRAPSVDNAPQKSSASGAPESGRAGRIPDSTKSSDSGLKKRPDSPIEVTPAKKPSSTTSLTSQKTRVQATSAPSAIIEGELVSVGQIGLLPWENRFGLQIGLERLGEIYYGALNVGINHRFMVKGEPLHFTLGVPLRFELLDARPNQRFNQVGRFRRQDWDEASDFAKVIQRLSYGSKEQRFYLDINRYSAHTIGHGLIMKRYDANLNFNTSRVGMQLDAFGDYVGFESMLNDITRPNLVGALVFVKPLSLINRSHYMMRSFSIGITGVTDLRGPVRNALDRDDIDNDGRRESELRVDQQTFQPDSLTIPVRGYGIDAEVKLVDHREFDLKTYVDYSLLDTGLPIGDPQSIDPEVVGSQRVRSGGFAWGNLIRSNLGIDPIHALRLRLEYRNYEPNYLPSYFDSLYEIQSIQYLPGGAIRDLANATKLQRVFTRNPYGDRVHGGYFEASWRVGDLFAMAMGLEINDQTPDNHAFIHFELPKAGKWQVSSTYHRRNAANRKELFEMRFAENDIWMFQTRHRTLDWLHTNLSVMTPFGFGPESVLRNAIQVNLSLEMGFSYGQNDKKKSRPQIQSQTPNQDSSQIPNQDQPVTPTRDQARDQVLDQTRAADQEITPTTDVTAVEVAIPEVDDQPQDTPTVESEPKLEPDRDLPTRSSPSNNSDSREE
jgi:hypothetical protein